MSSARLDIVLNLREARRRRGLTQRQVARLCGVHEKTISSFETGDRVSSLKVAQLLNLLHVYGLTPAEFFAWSPEDELESLRSARNHDERGERG
jgi:transcriptional regulator with XRE-family HTH domain